MRSAYFFAKCNLFIYKSFEARFDLKMVMIGKKERKNLLLIGSAMWHTNTPAVQLCSEAQLYIIYMVYIYVELQEARYHATALNNNDSIESFIAGLSSRGTTSKKFR